MLIATLATLLLSSGLIATGELLRMTAPRGIVAPRIASPKATRAPVRAPAAEAGVEQAEPAPESESEPVFGEPRKVASGIAELEQLAEELREAGPAAHKVTVLGTAPDESITLTALTLARLHDAHQAKVVVVDLVSVLADDVGGVGRCFGAGACGIDAGRGVVLADHHQGPVVARPPGQRRPSRI